MSNFTDFLIKPAGFGLDIGLRSLKIAQVSGPDLIGVNAANIPEGSFSHNGIKDKQILADIIKKSLAEAKPQPITSKFVYSGLPESLVFTKFLTIPEASSDELTRYITNEAIKFFPMQANEIYLDWEVAGQTPEGATEVLAVAASKKTVDDLVETMNLAGLEMLNIETKPLALTRALISAKENELILMADIGAKVTSLVILDNRTIRLTSVVKIGGDQLATDLAGSVQVLSQEISHLMKYYQNKLLQAKIFKKIILAGGGSNVQGAVEALEQSIHTQTVVGRPAIKTKSYDPAFSVAVGLAMKANE